MFPRPIQQLIDALSRLPGVGPKTAERYAFYLLRQPAEASRELATALAQLHAQTRRCTICLQYNDADTCNICRDPRRDPAVLCVVADSQDVAILEAAREFTGRYHVLGGMLSPVDGITPDVLSLSALRKRVDTDSVRELIIATDPTIEGEATALYIKQLLKEKPVKLTRLARGLPMGADIEYADPTTLASALQGRKEI
jgi:recombination protein RecR